MTNTNMNRENTMKKFEINHATKTIIMPKSIAKAASTYGTDAYNALVELQSTFPIYTVKVREVKRTSSRKDSKDSLKGLTFEYIEKFLAKNGSEEQQKDYELLRNPIHDGGLESKKASYVKIRKWFLKEFPQVLDYQKHVNEILA